MGDQHHRSDAGVGHHHLDDIGLLHQAVTVRPGLVGQSEPEEVQSEPGHAAEPIGDAAEIVGAGGNPCSISTVEPLPSPGPERTNTLPAGVHTMRAAVAPLADRGGQRRGHQLLPAAAKASTGGQEHTRLRSP